MFYRVEGNYGDFDQKGLFCLKNKWDIYVPLISWLVGNESMGHYKVYEVEGEIIELFENCNLEVSVTRNGTSEIIFVDGAYIKETSRRLIGMIKTTINFEKQQLSLKYEEK